MRGLCGCLSERSNQDGVTGCLDDGIHCFNLLLRQVHVGYGQRSGTRVSRQRGRCVCNATDTKTESEDT